MRQTFQLILYAAAGPPCDSPARRLRGAPDRYHDGSYREPPAEKREDYIRFYRTQAENFVAAARQIPER